MIRYSIHPVTWRNRIETTAPGWLERAAERTETFRALGRYDESSTIWSEVKRVYMELQEFKCGFCERRLEKSRFGNIEHDVEHFRPKKRVDDWPTDAITEERGLSYDFDLGDSDPTGYFLLPYHHENYLISCKTCNSALKRNYFPIADARLVPGTEPRDMRDEKPFLIYPLGAVDEDPEGLITFDGILPVPIGTRGHKRRRAEVTIDFFGLDRREVLLEERAEGIVALHLALEGLDAPDTAEFAAALVGRLVSDGAPHAACMRAYRGRVLQDIAAARTLAGAALDYLLSLAG